MPVRLPSSRRRSACRALAILVAGLPLAAQARTLEDVLTAASAYVARYEAELGAMVAVERYEQSISGPRLRRRRQLLESDFLFLRLPGTNEWLGFRDVYAVNGQPVRSRDDRLAALLVDPTADVAARAKAIVGESSKYNLGREQHTVNVPPLVLDWVTDRIRSRLVFSKGGEERVRGVRTWRVTFQETARPTLVRTPYGEDVLSKGSYWIEPHTGRILETELISHIKVGPGPFGLAYGARGLRPVTSTVRVSYRPDPRLNVLVPVEMREKLEVSADKATGTATYSNFRRFEATARIK